MDVRSVLVLGLGLGFGVTLVGCGDDASELNAGAGGSTTGGSAGSAGAGAGSGGLAGSGGVAGGAGCAGAPAHDDRFPRPSAQDIQFEAVSELPHGERIVYNDWGTPNSVRSMAPDGSSPAELFRALRVWSMSVEPSGARIAFSASDPAQEANYGVTFTDSIQHTWQYDVATQSVELIAHGNINDECHVYGPGGRYLYVCRRFDFGYSGDQGSFRGWELGRLDPACDSYQRLSPDLERTFELNPAPLATDSRLLFTRIVLPTPSTQTREIRRLDVASRQSEALRADADNPVISPDGSRYLYRSRAAPQGLFSASVSGDDAPIQISDQAVTSPIWSPSGDRVAYLVQDPTQCSHIEVRQADGSGAATRILDCVSGALAGQFVTKLSWLIRR